MSTDPLARLREAVAAEQAATAEKNAATIEALTPGSGVQQKDVAAVLGISREQLRRFAREHGIGPATKATARADG